MKVIELENKTDLYGMTLFHYEFTEKNVEIGDLIRKNKNNLGVIINKNKIGFYLGTPREDKIIITEFNSGTFEQSYLDSSCKEYKEIKDTIEEVYAGVKN